MKNVNVRVLVEGAMFSAIYGIFFYLSTILGGALESYAFILLPLPIAYFTTKYGFKSGFIVYFASVVIGFLINPLSTLFYFLTATSLGLVLGLLIKNKVKPNIRFIVILVSSIVFNSLTMFFFADLLGYDSYADIKSIFEYIVRLFGVKLEEGLVLNNLVAYSIPLLITITSLIESLLLEFAILLLFRKLKIEIYGSSKLLNFKVPRFAAFIYLAITIIFYSSIWFLIDKEGILAILGGFIFNLYMFTVFYFAYIGYFGYINLMRKLPKPQLRIVLLLVIIVLLFVVPMVVLLILSIIGFIIIISDYKAFL